MRKPQSFNMLLQAVEYNPPYRLRKLATAEARGRHSFDQLDTEYRPAGPKNIAVKIGGGIDTNAFNIRLTSEIAVRDPRYIQICRDLAEALNIVIGNESDKTSGELLKEPGFGHKLK